MIGNCPIRPSVDRGLFEGSIGHLDTNPQTVLKYEIAAVGSVRLDVFDFAGCKVKALIQETQPAGTHSITWQARDEQGHSLFSGVYFAHLQVDGNITTSKLTLAE